MEEERENVPFKVSFHGKRNHSDDAPYNFRNSVDPRIGHTQHMIDIGMFPDVYKWMNGEEVKDPKFERTFRESKKKKEKKKKGIGIVQKTGVFPLSKVERKMLADFRVKRASKEWRMQHRESIIKEIKDFDDNEEQIYRDRDIACAKAAVKFYNKKHGTDYEIVETLGSYSEMFNGFLYHCNFRAQRKCVTDSGSRPSPKLFFAELLNNIDAASVKICVFLDNPGPCKSLPHGRRHGCRICPQLMCHPVNYVMWHPDRRDTDESVGR